MNHIAHTLYALAAANVCAREELGDRWGYWPHFAVGCLVAIVGVVLENPAAVTPALLAHPVVFFCAWAIGGVAFSFGSLVLTCVLPWPMLWAMRRLSA